MTDSPTLAVVADIVAAFVANNTLSAAELPKLIEAVHIGLMKLVEGNTVTEPAAAPVRVPAVSVRKSVTPDFLICLEDGKRLKSLKRHLSSLGMTPDGYRVKWNLPADYPMVASNYAAQRSAIAKEIGLGQLAAARSAFKSAKVKK